MHCFQWDILYRWSYGAKETCFITITPNGQLTTCTKYPIGSNALWEVLSIFSSCNTIHMTTCAKYPNRRNALWELSAWYLFLFMPVGPV